MPRNREQLSTARVGYTKFCKRLAAMLQNPWDRGKTFGIIHVSRLAKHAITGGERRLKARLTFFAFNRFNQRGFFAANISAVAMYSI